HCVNTGLFWFSFYFAQCVLTGKLLLLHGHRHAFLLAWTVGRLVSLFWLRVCLGQRPSLHFLLHYPACFLGDTFLIPSGVLFPDLRVGKLWCILVPHDLPKISPSGDSWFLVKPSFFLFSYPPFEGNTPEQVNSVSQSLFLH